MLTSISSVRTSNSTTVGSACSGGMSEPVFAGDRDRAGVTRNVVVQSSRLPAQRDAAARVGHDFRGTTARSSKMLLANVRPHSSYPFDPRNAGISGSWSNVVVMIVSVQIAFGRYFV